jgi:Xaa-Pro dipeptidase
MDAYSVRRKKVAAWLKERGLKAALFEDNELRRDPSIRYLTGHPNDALLIVLDDGIAVLVPWDVNMAERFATADDVVPYNDFKRSAPKAMAGVLEHYGIPSESAVDIPASTPYPLYKDYVETLDRFDVRCSEDGTVDFVRNLRAIKEPYEIEILKKAALVTDEIMDEIERKVRDGSLTSEVDIALSIERGLRVRGAEGTGFDTIAAGPSRSFGIHAFPSYSGEVFGTSGFSILDFGVCVEGYTSDVTMTFVQGLCTDKQKQMIDLVSAAYDEALRHCKPGKATIDAARSVDEIFMQAGFAMPHALGHGIGLQGHELPTLRNREDNTAIFQAGHCVTIEPGLYDPEAGGIRLENDLVITESGMEIITHSRIVYL